MITLCRQHALECLRHPLIQKITFLHYRIHRCKKCVNEFKLTEEQKEFYRQAFRMFGGCKK